MALGADPLGAVYSPLASIVPGPFNVNLRSFFLASVSSIAWPRLLNACTLNACFSPGFSSNSTGMICNPGDRISGGRGRFGRRRGNL